MHAYTHISCGVWHAAFLEFESHIPASMFFLADALKAVTDNHNLHMQCIGDSDMQGASMSKDAEDVMHKMCGSETGSADGSS